MQKLTLDLMFLHTLLISPGTDLLVDYMTPSAMLKMLTGARNHHKPELGRNKSNQHIAMNFLKPVVFFKHSSLVNISKPDSPQYLDLSSLTVCWS